jgi:hypothetical protein
MLIVDMLNAVTLSVAFLFDAEFYDAEWCVFIECEVSLYKMSFCWMPGRQKINPQNYSLAKNERHTKLFLK